MKQIAQTVEDPYTEYPTSVTDLDARMAVVDWIGPNRAGRVGPDDIVLGLGAQNCVILALQCCLSGQQPVILTEELAYPGVRHAARLLRARLVGVEMDQHGIRPDRLTEAYRSHGGQVLVTASEVHSPTTIRTSLERKQEIAALAEGVNLQILEDDCHRVADSDIPGYRAIVPDRGWYISSLTKSVSSTLRFGFAACPTGFAGPARQVAQSSYYGLPQPMLDICTRLIDTGAAGRIREEVLQIIRKRVQLAVNIMGQWNISWRPEVPFLWLRLPQGWRGSSFAMACEGQGVRIKPADEFSLQDGGAPHSVRIALNMALPEPAFEAALRKVSTLLSQPPANVDS